MKRCPDCRRDYYDDSLLYCLDDGTALLEGPATSEPGGLATGVVSLDEPATAILHSAAPSSEAATRSHIHTTAHETGPGDSLSGPSQPSRSRFTKITMITVGAIAILVGAFFGYRYLSFAEADKIRSIAVLPFENRSADADTEYLSDGLAESLIYRLSQIPDLKVSPRSSVFRYKGQAADAEKVGGELGVDAVMSGRLVQRGDNLTISVDLVDVRNKKTLWGEQFERKMSDLLATQREIASAITEKLQLKLSGGDSKGITKQYTTSNEAYQLYLKGRYYWNKRTADNIQRSIELLKQATEKDPNFALAYAGLADCYVVLSTYTGQPAADSMPQSRAYANKSIELDPTLAEPHAALGLVNWALDWNKEEAQREFSRAIELDPNYPTAHHWYSRFLRAIGRKEEGLREIQHAEQLDPLSLIMINNVAEAHIDLGDLDAADNACQRMLELDANFWAAHQTLVWLRVKQGRLDDALVAAQKGNELSNRTNAALAQLGHVYGRLGRKEEAAAVIGDLEQMFSNKRADGKDLAVVYAGLGEKDKAFEWLDKAYDNHSFQLTTLNIEPLLQPLHDDPRWKDLKKRIGLPTE